MRTATKLTCSVLAAATLFGLSGLTAVANAAPPVAHSATTTAVNDDDMNAASSRGFDVTNRSGKDLRLDSVVGISHWGLQLPEEIYEDDSFPAIGSVLRPAQTMRFEVKDWSGHGLRAGFSGTANPNDQLNVSMTVSGVSRYSDATSNFGGAEAGGGTIVITDNPGTVTVPASDPTTQASILGLCATGAKCSFDPKGNQVKTYTDQHEVNSIDKIMNGTQDNLTRTLTIKETATASDNIEISATAKSTIMNIVELSVTAKYGHTWSKSHEFTDTQQVTVRPNHVIWVESVLPVIRTTGDFTVKLGSTTWILQGVTFDSPDPGRSSTFLITTKEMNDKEKAVYQDSVEFPTEISGTNSL